MQLPHHSFAQLEDELASFRLPAGGFEAGGTWRHEYAVLAPLFERASSSTRYGRLELERMPEEGGARLDVAGELVHGTERLQLEASVRCRADELATLRSWRHESVVADASRRPQERTRREVRRSLDAWLERDARGRCEPGARVTSDWTLLDALQRLPVEGDLPGDGFVLLQDLELPKGDQRLRRLEPITAQLGGRAVPLRGYVRFGRGDLPVHYWLDAQGRLLFAIGSLRILVLVGSA